MRAPEAWLFLFGCGSSCLPAAVEPQVADLYLVTELRPAAFSFTWSDPRSGGSDKDAYSSAWDAGAGLRWGFGSAGQPLQFLVGGAVVVASASQRDLTVNGTMARAEAGWCYGLNERWTLLLVSRLGLGRSTAHLQTGAGPDLSLTGGGWEAGAQAGFRCSLDRRWSVGFEAGWITTHDRLEGDGAELALRSSGPVAALAIAWTIDPHPRRLGGP